MKFNILHLLFLILLVAFQIATAKACQLSIPESYVPTFLNPPVSGHYIKCEEKPDEKCFCVDSVDPWTSELVDNVVLDYIAKSNEIICTDELDCDAKFIELSCSLDEEKIKNYDLLSVYCAKPIYKIEGKKLVESASKKAAYEAAQASKKQLEIELLMVQKARDCGSRAINVMSLRNAKKGLSKEQRKQILTIYEDIKNMLDVGSLDNAKDAITSAIADGVLITEQDKTAMIEAIVSCQ
jgi:hypothetical protein